MTAPLVSERLGEIQIALRERKLEGWLFSDHRGQNPLALRALGIGGEPLRRIFYWLPADSMPVLIAHAMEIETIPELPGETLSYTGWAELRRALDRTVPTRGAIAMEHASVAASPDVSRVEAGTVGLISSYGATVVPSIDLVNAFIGTLGAHEIQSLEASTRALASVRDVDTRSLTATSTAALRDGLTRAIAARGLTLVRAMITTNEATRTWPRAETDDALDDGALVMIDLFAKKDDGPCAHVSFAMTRGEPTGVKAMLGHACDARDAAIQLVEKRLARSERLLGYEVDDVARAALAKAGRRDVRHRTGSHIGRIPFSAEACTFDSLELEDTRAALPGHAWSVHPGVYDETRGVRAHGVIIATGSGVRTLDLGPREPLRVG